ncbi:MAG: NINE protein [Christensenellales bacterium]|jgi:TM2 domain-containing membrane protein YozV
MKEQTINQLIYQLDDLIPPRKIGKLKQALAGVGEEAYGQILEVPAKKPYSAVLLAAFLGFLGINRFYIRQYVLGVLKIALTVGAGILCFRLPSEYMTVIGAIYLAIYIADICFSFTGCRYANLAAIKKAIK